MNKAKAIACADLLQAGRNVTLLKEAGYENIRVVGLVGSVEMVPQHGAQWLVIGTDAEILYPDLSTAEDSPSRAEDSDIRRAAQASIRR